MGPSPSDEEKQTGIIRILEQGNQLPAEIRVASLEVKGVVEPVTEALGIRLILGTLTALEQARRNLSDHLC